MAGVGRDLGSEVFYKSPRSADQIIDYEVAKTPLQWSNVQNCFPLGWGNLDKDILPRALYQNFVSTSIQLARVGEWQQAISLVSLGPNFFVYDPGEGTYINATFPDECLWDYKFFGIAKDFDPTIPEGYLQEKLAKEIDNLVYNYVYTTAMTWAMERMGTYPPMLQWAFSEISNRGSHAERMTKVAEETPLDVVKVCKFFSRRGIELNFWISSDSELDIAA